MMEKFITKLMEKIVSLSTQPADLRGRRSQRPGAHAAAPEPGRR